MADKPVGGLTPEREARREIDAQLAACGWVVQDHKSAAVAAARGVAVREVPVGAGRADYVLFVDCQAVGVIEAKPVGTTLTGVESQTLGYRKSYPGELPMFEVGGVLPFGYESTGVETRFTCGLDPVAEFRDRLTRSERLERIDAEVDYDAAELDRRVVATDQIRTVAATLRDSLPVMFPDRKRRADGSLANVPKTLIFAKDDSHADDIVQIVREEFGLGNEAAVKITYRSGDSGHRPEDLLAQFRNAYNPRIAVTVDLIATGTDVKPIECVVFMRRVRSRNYFEQMKGRGVRVIDPDDLRAVTPDATVKDRFVLVDAVGVTDDDLHDTAPLERNRHESFDKLLSRIGLGSTEEATVSSVASRLARLDQRMTASDRAEVEKIAGMSLSTLAHQLVEALDPDRHVQAAAGAAGTDDPTVEQVAAAREKILRDALQPLAGNPELREKLIDVRRSYEQMIDSASADKVITGEFSVDAADRARRQTESFRTFIDDNRDQITALQVLYDQPHSGGLTYADIRELAHAIARPPHRWTTEDRFPSGLGACVTVVDVAIVRPGPESVDPNWLMWSINSPQCRSQIEQHQSGTTRKRVSRKNLATIRFAVPPLAEQRRIVATIEEHFSRLDAADATLAAAREKLAALQRSAVARLFDQADWPWTTLGEIAVIKGGVTKDSKRQSDPSYIEVPYLRVANVQRGYLDLAEVSRIRVSPAKAAQLALRSGDVLFNEGGDRDKLGPGWVWEGQVGNCIHQNHVFRARLSGGEFDPYFVSVHGNTWGQRWFETHGKHTTNLATLNMTTLKSFPVPAPPLADQRKVVAEFQSIRRSEDRLRTEISRAESRSASLRRSVLADAFSGRLVPQDPEDEPASVLLERIAASRSATPPRRRCRT